MSNLDQELTKLNPRQLSAVVTNDAPLRIIAGAGSGKTRVITMKIAYLIDELKVPSYKVLAVTFTNKAAKEMKERVVNLVGDLQGMNPRISTFHSFCYRVLREDGELIGLTKNFAIIDTNDQKVILKRIMKDLGIDEKHYSRAENKCLGAIDKWKNAFTEPTAAFNESENEEYKDYAKVYSKYEEELKKNSYCDFNDLQIKAYHLLNSNLEIRQKWRDKYDYVLVDEFQDTNELQFDIIKLLTEGKDNLTVVGDPDQTIYSWRGAQIQYILNFNKVYKNAKTIILNQNYRSTKQIVDAADSFIENNDEHEKKDVIANGDGNKVVVHETSSQKEEANYIAKKIKDMVEEGIYNYRDFFILYRINAWSRELETALTLYKIPYQLIGGIKFRERKVIKDATSWLKAVSIRDNMSVERAISVTPKIGATTVEKLRNIATASNRSMYQVMTDSKEEVMEVSKHLGDVYEIFKQASEMFENNLAPVDILKYELQASGYEEKMKLIAKSEDDEQNLNALYDQLTDFANNFDPKAFDEENVTLAFLQEEALGGTDEEQTPNMVTLLTIHSAKGLENKVVFVAGLSAGVFPSKRSLFNNKELEEERRTLYVAMTRAEKELFITYVTGEYSFITGSELAPSRFIKELNEDMIIHEKSASSSIFSNDGQSSTLTRSSGESGSKTTNMKVGDIVVHPFFGEGVIVKVIGGQLQIAFNNPAYGIKVIPANNGAITKK